MIGTSVARKSQANGIEPAETYSATLLELENLVGALETDEYREQ